MYLSLSRKYAQLLVARDTGSNTNVADKKKKESDCLLDETTRMRLEARHLPGRVTGWCLVKAAAAIPSLKLP